MSRVEQEAAAWLSYLDSVIACAEDTATTARIKREGDDAGLLGACGPARSVSTARAVVHLISLGHVVEARMLARSIFENEFYLYRLARDGSAFVREMVADEVDHRGALGETMFKEEQAREAMGEEGRARMRAFIKGLRQEARTRSRSSQKTPSPGPDVSAAYAYYQELVVRCRPSFDHSAQSDVVETTENEIVGLSLRPRIKDGEAMDTAFLAAVALLGVCISANKAFDGTTGGKRLEELVAEYYEIATRTFPGRDLRVWRVLEIHRPPLSVLGVGP